MKRLSRPVYTPVSVLDKKLLLRLSDNDPSLVRLIFSARNLGDPGVHALTRALSTNTRLRELDLCSNAIGPEGARCVAALLRRQTTRDMSGGGDVPGGTGGGAGAGGGLTTLALCDNALRDAGVAAVALALATNARLETLCIGDNFVGAAGVAMLAAALRSNATLTRLHIHHNSFQSLAPLITCTFDKRSFDSVASSNHTLRHVFLNCGYSYECEELEAALSMNRLGKAAARRTKIALFLEEDLDRLLQMDLDSKLLPGVLGMLAQQGRVSTLFRVLKHLPSEMLAFGGLNNRHAFRADEPMEVRDPMDVDMKPV